MKKPKIFIACDTTKKNEVRKIIAQTKTNKLKIGYKFGLEFFLTVEGRKFISKLKNKEIFLDLKLNDIPNTCVAAFPCKLLILKSNVLIFFTLLIATDTPIATAINQAKTSPSSNLFTC